MLRQASPKLAPLRLGKLNRPRRICGDAIPDVADELDALGNRQLENLCLGCAHVTDSTTNGGPPLSRGISGVYVEMGYVRACIRLWNSARSMSFAVPASISASRRTISCSQASRASLSAGASRLVTSACASSARSAPGSESASDLSLLRVEAPCPKYLFVYNPWLRLGSYCTGKAPRRKTSRNSRFQSRKT
jgi:hypothetical protein